MGPFTGLINIMFNHLASKDSWVFLLKTFIVTIDMHPVSQYKSFAFDTHSIRGFQNLKLQLLTFMITLITFKINHIRFGSDKVEYFYITL